LIENDDDYDDDNGDDKWLFYKSASTDHEKAFRNITNTHGK